MLAKDRTNLKIEEIRMHKHHEIHRVKPLMPASCRIRQGNFCFHIASPSGKRGSKFSKYIGRREVK
ncbi:regulator [Shigella sonnei]|nr:regulator [Shigella sonnei]